MMAAPVVPIEPIKPKLRGISHQLFFFIALAAGILLIAKVPADKQLGTIIYVMSFAGLFGISALYHRPKWSPAVRQWIRRIDHAGIVLLIGGTSTPLAMALDSPSREHFLLAVGIGTALGVARALFWIAAPKYVASLVGLALGWSMLPFIKELYFRIGWQTVLWIAAGGVLYSAGAVIYARKRPDPWPSVFGYHEIFHALVVLAAALHFVAVARVVLL